MHPVLVMEALHRSLIRFSAAAALSLALGPALSAQSGVPEALLLEGTNVGGNGSITQIKNLAINNNGEWIVHIDTDHIFDTADEFMIRDNTIFAREGMQMDRPNSATLKAFGSCNLSNIGFSGWELDLDGVSLGRDSGIYVNLRMVLREGDMSTSNGFSNNTQYFGFLACDIIDLNRIASIVIVDDPAIPSSSDQAIVILRMNDVGQLQQEKVRVKEGDVLGGQVAAIESFETAVGSFDYNNSLSTIFVAQLDTTDDQDHAIYLDDDLIAQEGDPSVIGGRIYEFLSFRSVAINDHNEYCFRANLDGAEGKDELIVKNNEALAREGFSIPAIGNREFVDFGNFAPLWFGNDGRVLWYGEWDDPNFTINAGLFLDRELIVQKGVTQVNGLTITELAHNANSYALSDDGKWIIFKAELQGGIEGAFRLQIVDLEMTGPVPGQAGGANTWTMTGAEPGKKCFFTYSFDLGNRNIPPCPGLSLDIQDPIILGIVNADVNGMAELTVNVPGLASGRTIYYQGAQPAVCKVTDLVPYTFP